MIRPMTSDDIPAILPMARRFLQFSEYRALNDELSDECIITGIGSVIDMNMSLVADDGDRIVGFLFGIVGPLWFAQHIQVAVELAWWVDPEHRGLAGVRLLQTFEQLARERGLRYVAMSDLVLNGSEQSPASRILGHFGYTLCERMHAQEI